MRTVESAALDDSLQIEMIQSVLREHSVQLALLFGSYASGTPHSESDIDIAVELETTQRDDPAYNDAFFGLGAALSEQLGTDDVDLVDIHALSPSVATSVFEHGVLLVGDETHAKALRHRVANANANSESQSPRNRFDTALAKIDEHLGGSAVTATERSSRER